MGPAFTPSYLLHNVTECGSKTISIFLIDGQKQGGNQDTGLSWWLSGKESTCQCWRLGFDPWVGMDPLGKEMATHSSILAWKTPQTEEPGGLHIIGLQRVGHD